jgi:L,D-transpeptidase YcbB
MFYTTAMATADQVLFFDDIYNLDNPLLQALSRPLQKKAPDTVTSQAE